MSDSLQMSDTFLSALSHSFPSAMSDKQLERLFSTFGGVLSDDINLLVEAFVKLLYSPLDDVREQAVCALGVVAGDSPKGRDLVLSHGALTPLLDEVTVNAKISMLRKAAWALSNLCKGEWHEPQPPFKKMRPYLKKLLHLVDYEDEEVLTYSCQALSYLSNGTYNQIDAVIKAGVCPRLVELLRHRSPSVLIPALETVGNIVAGTDTQIQVILDLGPLGCLLNLLTDNPNESVKKEVCFIISNITDGSENQIQAVIEARFIGLLVKLLQTAESDITKYAARAIFNASSGGSHEQIKYLVDEGCIKPLCDLLLSHDPRIVTVCLGSLGNILLAGEVEKKLGGTGACNCYAPLIDDVNIKNLLSHDNSKIAEESCYICDILEGDLTDSSPEEFSVDTDSSLEELFEDMELSPEDKCEDTSSLLEEESEEDDGSLLDSEDDVGSLLDSEDDVGSCIPYMSPESSSLGGTSIMGLKTSRHVLIVADSRTVYRAFGNVHHDSRVKLHWITKDVFGAGAGSPATNDSVFNAVRDHMELYRDHPSLSVEIVAQLVGITRAQLPGLSQYIIGGRLKPKGKGKLFEVRASGRRGENGSQDYVDEDSQYHIYKTNPVKEVVGGSGENALLTVWTGANVRGARGSITAAAGLMKRAMRNAKRNRFTTGGPINMVAITKAKVHFFQAVPDSSNPSSDYGGWIPGGFVPQGFQGN